MQERRCSTIVNYVEYLMTQQIEQDHFAFGEHSIFHVSIQDNKAEFRFSVQKKIENNNTSSVRYKN